LFERELPDELVYERSEVGVVRMVRQA